MSNLLEQAIIDAAALRETALKSAQDALVEKYKDEFQDTLEKLLEQEDASSIPPENIQTPAIDQSLNQTAGLEAEESGGEAFKDVPSSFLDGDDDELIKIDFDKLEKQLSDVLGSPILAAPGMENIEQPEQQIAPEAGTEEQPLAEEIDLTVSEEGCYEEQDELEEELELDEASEEKYEAMDSLNPTGLQEEDSDENIINLTISDEDEEEDQEEQYEYELDEDSGSNVADYDTRIANLKAQTAQAEKEKAEKQKDDIKKNAAETAELQQPTVSEDFELTEEELAELEEELSVDLDSHKQSRGYMGSTEGEEEKLDDVEKAAARDDEETEEREEEKRKLKDLECELQETKKNNNRYVILVNELKDNLITLKEHTEKLTVSNAKLLYINKVFGNNSLNERQKQTIVESISKASSVLEARTIYDTLQSTLESVSVKKPRESLGEALNRGSSGFINRPKVSSFDENVSDRLKILAGIKNRD